MKYSQCVPVGRKFVDVAVDASSHCVWPGSFGVVAPVSVIWSGLLNHVRDLWAAPVLLAKRDVEGRAVLGMLQARPGLFPVCKALPSSGLPRIEVTI